MFQSIPFIVFMHLSDLLYLLTLEWFARLCLSQRKIQLNLPLKGQYVARNNSLYVMMSVAL